MTASPAEGTRGMVDDGDRIWVGGSAIAVVSGKVDL
ncbi:hypothetical protein JOC45_002016 [Gordonia hydrophobica]|nr:hypothetical protein [Gordonia hydrophobica]